MRYLSYVARRVLQIAPVLFFVITVNFLLVHLSPGDPAWALAGENASPKYVESLRERYGLDRPILEQYGRYIVTVLHGDLGYSYTYHKPVLALIAQRLPSTLLLVLFGQLLAIVVGTLLGTYSARHYSSVRDKLLGIFTLTLYSMPIFWLGLLLILIFAVWGKGLLPSSGMYSVPRIVGWNGLLDTLRHMILPTVALTLYGMPTYYRLTRSAILDIMDEDFVKTLRAVGLSKRTLFLRHCLRNALLPSVTMAGLTFGSLLSGALLTETVFSWPGMGRLMYESVFQRDFPVSMGVFLVSALGVIIATLVTDITYLFLDPRIIYSKGT